MKPYKYIIMKFLSYNYLFRPLLFKKIQPWPRKLYLAIEGAVLEKKK